MAINLAKCRQLHFNHCRDASKCWLIYIYLSIWALGIIKQQKLDSTRASDGIPAMFEKWHHKVLERSLYQQKHIRLPRMKKMVQHSLKTLVYCSEDSHQTGKRCRITFLLEYKGVFEFRVLLYWKITSMQALLVLGRCFVVLFNHCHTHFSFPAFVFLKIVVSYVICWKRQPHFMLCLAGNSLICAKSMAYDYLLQCRR